MDEISASCTMCEDMFSFEADVVIMTEKRKICFKNTVSDKEIVKKTQIQETERLHNLKNYKLRKKYFDKWKEYTINTDVAKNRERIPHTKINEFISILKIQKQVLLSNTESRTFKALKATEIFKNRFKFQNRIIDKQKEKLDEQNEIINELKSGIIREDLLKSVENTKHIIREIFGNCSEKLLCKAPLLEAVDEREKIMISAQKAPKLIQKTQQRYTEREKYREEILKRKKMKEQARQALLREIIENKKSLEEEERKRRLEIMNEQRKRELKLQELRQQKKQQFEKNHSTAVYFYNKILIKQCFKKLFNTYNKARENVSLATTVFLHKQKLKVFKAWLVYVEEKYNIKNGIADAHLSYKILERCVVKWKEFKLEGVRSLQVAEDLYDFRLSSNTFIHWHRYICKEIMIEYNKNREAVKHNNRHLLFKFFYQWRYLPAVIQMERAKEETKRKWRQKVWEFLPDYMPPEHV